MALVALMGWGGTWWVSAASGETEAPGLYFFGGGGGFLLLPLCSPPLSSSAPPSAQCWFFWSTLPLIAHVSVWVHMGGSVAGVPVTPPQTLGGVGWGNSPPPSFSEDPDLHGLLEGGDGTVLPYIHCAAPCISLCCAHPNPGVFGGGGGGALVLRGGLHGVKGLRDPLATCTDCCLVQEWGRGSERGNVKPLVLRFWADALLVPSGGRGAGWLCNPLQPPPAHGFCALAAAGLSRGTQEAEWMNRNRAARTRTRTRQVSAW